MPIELTGFLQIVKMTACTQHLLSRVTILHFPANLPESCAMTDPLNRWCVQTKARSEVQAWLVTMTTYLCGHSTCSDNPNSPPLQITVLKPRFHFRLKGIDHAQRRSWHLCQLTSSAILTLLPPTASSSELYRLVRPLGSWWGWEWDTSV